MLLEPNRHERAAGPWTAKDRSEAEALVPLDLEGAINAQRGLVEKLALVRCNSQEAYEAWEAALLEYGRLQNVRANRRVVYSTAQW